MSSSLTGRIGEATRLCKMEFCSVVAMEDSTGVLNNEKQYTIHVKGKWRKDSSHVSPFSKPGCKADFSDITAMAGCFHTASPLPGRGKASSHSDQQRRSDDVSLL